MNAFSFDRQMKCGSYICRLSHRWLSVPNDNIYFKNSDLFWIVKLFNRNFTFFNRAKASKHPSPTKIIHFQKIDLCLPQILLHQNDSWNDLQWDTIPTGIGCRVHSQIMGFQSHSNFLPRLFCYISGSRIAQFEYWSDNVLDVLAVANHIIGLMLLPGDALCRADCDANSTINVLDALGIANVIIDIIDGCPP